MTEVRHIPCGACGADEPRPIGAPRASAEARAAAPGWEQMRVVRCARCGFYYVDPMPFWSDDALQALYGAEYFVQESPWWHRQRTEVNPRTRLEAIARYGGISGGRLLDIGCGQGYVLEHALQRGWEAWGLEPAQVWAHETAARLGVQIWAKRVEEATIPEASCDVAFSDSVIEHLPEPLAMMRLARRVLRPGGLFFLVTPNAEALVNHFRHVFFRLAGSPRAPFIEPLSNPYHIVGFTPHSLRVLAERAGFRVRRMWVRHGLESWRKERGWASSRLKSLTLMPALLAGELSGRGTTIDALLSLA